MALPVRPLRVIQTSAFTSHAAENNKVDITKTSLQDFLASRKGFQRKKLLLVIPNIVGDKIAATAPLPGVAYVAGFVRSAGHDVRVVDMRIDRILKNLFAVLDDYEPDYIGLSFMTQHEFGKIFDFVTDLHNHYPHAKLVIGGAGASALYDRVLKETVVDYVVTREGEYTIVQLLDGLLPEDKIGGLIWNNHGAITINPHRKFEYNIDELPFPAYDLFPVHAYVDRKIPIVTSRGCPYKCTFCANKASMGVAWRPRSPENILKELQFWCGKGFRVFHFVDDNFTLDMKRAEKICDLIIKSSIKIKWDLRNGIRVDRVSETLLTKMKQAGCFYFAFGIESIDQQVLNKMKKDLEIEKIEEGVRIAEKVGIPFGGFFIVGLLDDTFEKFLRLYDFANSHNFSEVRFYNPIPFPGTELYEELVDRNLLLVDPSDYLNYNSKFKDEPVFETPEFSLEERKQALKMGQRLVMQKFLIKEFGNIFGTLAYRLWNVEPLREIVKKPGMLVWKVLRKLKRHPLDSGWATH